MNEIDIIEMAEGDLELEDFLFTVLDSTKGTLPYVERLEDCLREELKKKMTTPDTVFSVLAIFSARMISVLKGSGKMDSEACRAAYKTYFDIAFDTYNKIEDEKKN